MDFRILCKNSRDFRAYEPAEVEMANEAIVVFVVLVRQLVLCVCFFVLAFWGREFFGQVFDRVHRLEGYRK